MRYRVGKAALPYLYLLSATILLVGLLVLPFVSGIAMSLQSMKLSGEVKWVGLGNFLMLFRESRFSADIRNSLFYILGNILLSTPFAYGAALLITSKFKQAFFFRGIFLLPWIIAPVVSTVLFRSMVDPTTGPVSAFLSLLAHKQIIILSNPTMALVTVIVHSFWRSFPFIMLFLAAGMASIPDELYESAVVDGANSWKRFIHITVPLTSNQLGLSLLMVTIWTLHDAETIYAFTQGGPGYSTETLAVRLFKMSFINFDLNMGATIGVILILISLVFMFFYLKLSIGKDLEK
jgi:ABC-type sugar transport system permease subunit